jgi:hypothetical protein
MTFSHAQTIVVPEQEVKHRGSKGRLLSKAFVVKAKEEGNLKIRNYKGNPRTVKQADWDEVLANLSSLRGASLGDVRRSMKTRNSTYVLSIIGLWEDKGHKF